jgi:hypothetical protein
MKKLILVTLLAVAASWLLSEVRQPGDEKSATPAAPYQVKARRGEVAKSLLVVQDSSNDQRPGPNPIPRPGKVSKSRQKQESTASPSPTAKPAPSWFPASEDEEQAKARVDAFGSRVLVGRVSASEERARQDLRNIVERQVSDWLLPEVPTSWKVPARVIDGMGQGSYVQEVTRNLTATDPSAPSTAEALGLDGLYNLYRAGQKLDFSTGRRAQLVAMYHHDLATRRLQRLGGGMALALVGLAVLSGYIKADEATKGYYTNRLRLAAAAGLGVAGVLAYRFLA